MSKKCLLIFLLMIPIFWQSLKYLWGVSANNRKYFGSSKNDNNDWMPSMPSRFVDELDKKYLKINETNSPRDDDFVFSQDISFNQSKKSPGWQRYQQEKEKVKVINYTNNLTSFKIGQSVSHDTFGFGKIIHIDGNKMLINFKESGEKKFPTLV